MRSAITAAVSASLALTSVAATAQSADALSIAGSAQRAGAELDDPNNLGGITLILALIGAAVVVGLFVLLDDDDDEPASP